MTDAVRRATIGVLVLLTLWCCRVIADDAPARTTTQNAPPTAKKSGVAASSKANANAIRGNDSAVTEPISAEREAAANEFARQHHAELALLLGLLKESHPEQYTKAVRELDRTRERLEKQREKDVARHAILLREWQVDSRVRLLAARMMMSTAAELETELRAALAERHDVRLQLLTYDRERTKTRVQKMDEQIAEHVQNRDGSIDREFERIKKTVEVRKKSVKPAAKNRKP